MRCLALCLTLVVACKSAETPAPNTSTRPDITPAVARGKLEAISPKKVQLWVVVHIRAHKHVREDGTIDEARLIAGALQDTQAVVDGGGDAIILINSRAEMPVYERVITAVREQHPDFPLGISALSYGPENLTEGFRLAKKYGAKIVWCEVVPDEPFEYEDDDGSFKPAVTTPKALALATQAELAPDAMLVAGVHMKYTRPTDGVPFPDAVKRARGTVDGIIITGPKTGVLADVERVRLGREMAGEHVMGLASGVSTENIASVIQYIDFAIVGTSLKVSDDPLRTDPTKVRALRTMMDELGGS